MKLLEMGANGSYKKTTMEPGDLVIYEIKDNILQIKILRKKPDLCKYEGLFFEKIDGNPENTFQFLAEFNERTEKFLLKSLTDWAHRKNAKLVSQKDFEKN